MTIHDVAQGSDEWIRLRLGIPTASCFSKILTPKTFNPSKQSTGYMMELLAEWAFGEAADSHCSPYMERGTELEPRAVRAYEFENDCETTEVGFVTNRDGTVGCSPDRLIGEDAGLEIKCPSAKVHLGYLLNGAPTDYALQVHGALWLTARHRWDLYCWHPVLPAVTLRYYRDGDITVAISDAVTAFVERLEEAKERLRGMGVVPALERGPVTSLADAAGVADDEFDRICDEIAETGTL
jgi:hypothetical protein